MVNVHFTTYVYIYYKIHSHTGCFYVSVNTIGDINAKMSERSEQFLVLHSFKGQLRVTIPVINTTNIKNNVVNSLYL